MQKIQISIDGMQARSGSPYTLWHTHKLNEWHMSTPHQLSNRLEPYERTKKHLFTPLSGVYVSNRACALIKLPFNQATWDVNQHAYAQK